MSILSYNLILSLLFASLSPLFTPAVSAQSSSISYGQIVAVNSTGFPNIVVHAIIRNVNNEPVPVSDLGSVQILENGDTMPTTVQQVEGGVETMIVVDFSSSVSKKREDLILILTSLINAMTAADTTGIILEQPEGVTILQPLTSDTTVLKNALNQIPASNPGLSIGIKGVDSALTELAGSLKKQSSVQSILLISPGIADQRSLPDVLQRARNARAPVHTLLLKSTIDEPTQRLQEVARETKGIAVQYTNADSLIPINNWLQLQKAQTQWTYRSKSATSSERLIEIRTTANQKLDQAAYTVILQAARVIIDFPANNKEYIRQAASPDSDLYTIEPTTDQVIAHVEWTDGYPRKLVSAQLFVDGTAEGSPKSNPDDKNITFSVNLRKYREPGDNQSQLRVEVKDELGLENKSSPTIINIRVVIPTPLPTPTLTQVPTITPTPQPCSEYDPAANGNNLPSRIRFYWCQAGQTAQNYNAYTGIIALGVALLAIVLAIFFRRPISKAAVTAGDKVRDLIVNLTRPTHAEVVGAYLRVLKGDDSLAVKPIPLYINTVTPLGRDIRQAEVVLQAEVERSVISRKHCEIVEEAGEFRIRDYGSSHGTFVNGYRLPEGGEGQKLEDGDEIALGPIERGGVLLMFQLAAPGGLAPSSAGVIPPVQPQAVKPYPQGNFAPFTTHPTNDNISGITRPLHREDSSPAPSNRGQGSPYTMSTPASMPTSLTPPVEEPGAGSSDIENAPTYGVLEPPSFMPPSPVSLPSEPAPSSPHNPPVPDQSPDLAPQAQTGTTAKHQVPPGPQDQASATAMHQSPPTIQIPPPNQAPPYQKSFPSTAETQRIHLNDIDTTDEQEKEDPTLKLMIDQKPEEK